MKPLEIKGARTRLGLTQQDMADKLDMSIHSYQKKESGHIKFTEDERFAVADILGLSFEQYDEFLCDNKFKKFFAERLPNGNVETA